MKSFKIFLFTSSILIQFVSRTLMAQGVQSLRSIQDSYQFELVKNQIIELTQAISDEGIRIDIPLLRPMSISKLDDWYNLDISHLSQVYLNEEGEVLGFLIAHPDEEVRDTFYIEKFAVSPRARGKGVGRKLMYHFAQAASDSGYREGTLAVFRENESAQKAYLSYGFEEATPSSWSYQHPGGLKFKAKSEMILERTQPLCEPSTIQP